MDSFWKLWFICIHEEGGAQTKNCRGLEDMQGCQPCDVVCDHPTSIRLSLRDRDAQQKNRNIVENVGGTPGVELLFLDVSSADLQMQGKSVGFDFQMAARVENIPSLRPRSASTLFQMQSHDMKVQAPIHPAAQYRISDVEINVEWHARCAFAVPGPTARL